MKKQLALVLLLASSSAFAQYKVVETWPMSVGKLEGKGQLSNPVRAPGGSAYAFQFHSADGESAEVYVCEVEDKAMPPKFAEPVAVVPSKADDVFSLGAVETKMVSEYPAWGATSKRDGRQGIVVAATKKEAARGGTQVSFDLYFSSKGKKGFLAEHPDNDSSPAFSPDGEYLAFSSGRSGEGDIYLYSFFSENSPILRLTFEETGSELYPTFSPDGKSLAYIGHLGSSDHLMLINDVKALAQIGNDGERQSAARGKTKDLTSGWAHSAFAPSFSPSGSKIAFFMHPKGELTTDLYVVNASGGEPALLMEKVLPFSVGGPAWSPNGDGLFVVEENAKEMNPIVFVSLNPQKGKVKLDTKTQLNNDISAFRAGDNYYLLYVAQGGGETDKEKRWRKVFISKVGL